MESSPTTRTTAWLVAGACAGLVGTLSIAGIAYAWLRPDEAPAAMAAPRLVGEAEQAGIDHAYAGGFDFFVGGGLAVFDCDADGRPDLYLAGGANPASLYRNQSPREGSLRFVEVSDPVTDLTGVTGAYPIDIDSDAIGDLVVLRFGENVVLRGRGDCQFERANELWGVEGGEAWTTAFSATWEGGATFPTLAFGNYLTVEQSEEQARSCADNALIRPGESGYGPPTPLSPGWCTLSILFHDWDRSGRADLRMTNDRHYYHDGEEQLWAVPADDRPRLYTRDEGWQRIQIWGMGIATYDVTGDGLPEVFLTSQGDNKLQTLDAGGAGPSYGDIALQRGVTAHRPYTGGDVMPSTAWHPEFADVNNDGYIDLFISKGNVEAMPEFATMDPSNLLLGQPDGRFVEGAVEAGIVGSPHGSVAFPRGRGAALVDLNLDGLLDVVQVNRRENVDVWRNVGAGDSSHPEPMGSWVAVRLRQPALNTDAVGAWVEVRSGSWSAARQVTIGGGHASGQLGWVHFGLGARAGAEVRVRWPDGTQSPWTPAESNRFLIFDRAADTVISWDPPDT